MILGIPQGGLLGLTLKVNMMRLVLKLEWLVYQSSVILALTRRILTIPKIADARSFHQFQSFMASEQPLLLQWHTCRFSRFQKHIPLCKLFFQELSFKVW